MNSPILLSSGELTIPKWSTVEPETTRMQNPFRTPMLIDEIRFRTNALGFFNGLMSSKVEILLGRSPLTNGMVPIGNLCKVLLDGNFGSDGGALPYFHHTWKLPKPLYVPPEELLTCRLHYSGEFGGSATTVMQVTYAGRSLPSNFPRPKTQWLPWAAAFQTASLALTDGNSDETISDQADLVNPFDEPLRVQRFIGRTLRNNNLAANELGQQAGDQAPSTMTFVRAVDSFGNILVRDPTPFTHLFQFVDRTWTVNAVLPPKGFYLFQINRDYTITVANTSFAHAISMVGYREVKVP